MAHPYFLRIVFRSVAMAIAVGCTGCVSLRAPIEIGPIERPTADGTILGGLKCAVAGIGRSDAGKERGTWLVPDGHNTGATARVAPQIRHPRTAAGVTADGRTLILAVVDGRQKNYSAGATLPELADVMI